MRCLLQIISTSRVLLIFKGLRAHPRECGTQPPLIGWRKGPRVFHNVCKLSWGKVWRAAEVCSQSSGALFLLPERQEDFHWACKLSWAGQSGELPQQHGAASINPGLHSNLTGHIWPLNNWALQWRGFRTELTAGVQEPLGVREGNIPQFFINEKIQLETVLRIQSNWPFCRGKWEWWGGCGAVLRNGLWCLQGWFCWCGKVTSLLRAEFDAKDAELRVRLVPRGCGKGSCSQPAYLTLVWVGKDLQRSSRSTSLK